MKTILKLLVSIYILGFISMLFADIEIITLQQGIDGYEGCVDTYLKDEAETAPRGDTTGLVLHGYH